MVTVRTNLPDKPDNHALTREGWLKTISASRSENDFQRIQDALVFLDRHQSSDENLLLSLSIADTLLGLDADTDTIITGLVHFHPDVEKALPKQLEEWFGKTVAKLLQGLKEMSVLGNQPEEAQSLLKDHAEGLRRMLLAVVKDVRVILVKLASRLQCMRLLKNKPVEQQLALAHETQEIFAPLANRLGIWQLKWELEDLSFRYLHPVTYKRIAKLLDEKRLEREDYINEVIGILKTALEQMGIHAEITGRPKHIYSIWRKMVRKGVDFDQIFDVRAVRVLVDKLEHCYTVLGVAHAKWQHIAGEFDDYIATPKENMYQSLHTALIGPGGKPLEVQIRTFEMHQHAEQGIASHWRYKEGGQYNDQYERRLAWMRQLLDAKEDVDDLMERFKDEVSEDRVYVFTPRGKVIDMVQGATVLDFAYMIHTDIGHRCKGAKVNGAIVPLTYELKSGETVEILTGKLPSPSKNWLVPHLGYIRTPKARAKIKGWFRQQDYEDNLADGKAILDRTFQRMGAEKDMPRLLARFKQDKESALLVAIGRGDISSVQIASFIEDEQSDDAETVLPQARSFKPVAKSDSDVEILGVENLLTQMAGCCKPVPGDDIIGYITRGRGVTIHRQDCPSLQALGDDEQDRLIEVSWSMGNSAVFSVDIFIRAEDRRGLLSDIISILTHERINVLSTQSNTNQKTQIADISLTLQVKGISQLSKVLDRIGQLPSVLDVYRKSK